MQVNLTDREIEAIGNVVDHYLLKEEADYNTWLDTTSEDEVQLFNHIYTDLEILNKLYIKLKK